MEKKRPKLEKRKYMKEKISPARGNRKGSGSITDVAGMSVRRR